MSHFIAFALGALSLWAFQNRDVIRQRYSIASCDQHCFTPCNSPLDLPDGSANTLLAVSKVNRGLLVECSARRDACGACLDSLKQARIVQ
jgi:hypothetical protein